MRIKPVIWIMLMFVAGAAHANNFNTQCAYSHTWPDDPIVYPGKPGEAMVHDFFGNPNANAYSTYDSLNSNKVTTCDSKADPSSYWAPQLKRASGIVMPIAAMERGRLRIHRDGGGDRDRRDVVGTA